MNIQLPQLLLIIMITLDLGVNIIKHGESRRNYNVGYKLIDIIIIMALLIWGGFFS